MPQRSLKWLGGSSLDRLGDRVALVTGAAQGIGAAIATSFAAEGARVVALDVQEDGVAAVASRLGERAIGIVFDITQIAEIPSLLDRIEAEVGLVDVLVNCAGICPTHTFSEASAESLRSTLEVNLVGPFALMHEVARRLVARSLGGSIINLASISAFLPKTEQLEYGASKAAIVSVTRSAAASLAIHGIRVNAIAPGAIETPMTRANAERRSVIRGLTAAEALQPLVDASPMKRLGSPEEVAALAVFLASEDSSFINGQTIDVCGGQLMR